MRRRTWQRYALLTVPGPSAAATRDALVTRAVPEVVLRLLSSLLSGSEHARCDRSALRPTPRDLAAVVPLARLIPGSVDVLPWSVTIPCQCRPSRIKMLVLSAPRMTVLIGLGSISPDRRRRGW